MESTKCVIKEAVQIQNLDVGEDTYSISRYIKKKKNKIMTFLK